LSRNVIDQPLQQRVDFCPLNTQTESDVSSADAFTIEIIYCLTKANKVTIKCTCCNKMVVKRLLWVQIVQR